MDKKADVLFEVSWEVCNKVGGIFTVVKSKAAKMVEAYGGNYFLVGPYFASKAIGQFEEELPNDFCKAAFDELKKNGIICHFGRWLVEGSPNAILIDFVNYRQRTNDIKKELWDWHKIDSLKAPQDYDEPIVWAYAAGMLIESFLRCHNDRKIAAHFHEWLSGAGLLYLKKKGAKAATIFTTHATILGRTLASSNVDLYNVWSRINPDEEAYKYNIEAKHLVEKNSALAADAFTTVSEITGMEASYFLKKKPDFLLPNGLDMSKFPSFEDIVIKHQMQRNRIREFMLYYFFPYYTFDPKDTLIYFLAGRYEFHDKGIDIFIKALGRLSEKLKRSKSKKTIIAFIWVPANFRNIKHEMLENKTLFQDIKDALEEVMGDVEKNIIYSFVSGKKLAKEDLFEDEFLAEMRIRISRLLKKGNPPLLTHDLYDENDTIQKAIIATGLRNAEDDRVKIIYYPIYLSGADGLLNLNYYEAMQGSHLGIFPSYYEPWGYTPLEAGALGVSSVTTDLAGFGRYFCSECQQSEMPGIYVLKRLNKSDDEVVSQLVDVMLSFAEFSKEDRIANKLQARKIASMADWKIFVNNYIEAHNYAISRVYKQ
ncbi:hypothetical protein HYS31_03110 [Candidatus Woesearchaeota archaeon]|nr:hypothetical protein [Candidatus Woesearchaeota archaeon]